MAGAMVRGILRAGISDPAHIRCTGARDGTAEALAGETGIEATYDYARLLQSARWVVLACKPQQVDKLPPELAELTRDRYILSILAGTPLQRLRGIFPNAANIVRAMPNTPGMIGRGITAFAPLQPLSGQNEEAVRAILSSLGEVLEIDEHRLNAVTGLSGSGPAYVFEFVAALRDGGIQAGLTSDQAYRLALKTVQGAAELLEAVPESPETHRDWVSSPGGTTLAGLQVLSDSHFRQLIADTVRAAKQRAEELA